MKHRFVFLLAAALVLAGLANADEKPGDGTEVTYLQFKVRSKKDLDRLLNSDEVTLTFDEEFNRNGHAEPKSEPTHADRKTYRQRTP